MMKRSLFVVLLTLGVVGCGSSPISSANPPARSIPSAARSASTFSSVAESKSSFSLPLSGGLSRVTKKFFGTFVSPGHSPVSPERFTGYHTGIDFETTAVEQNIDVPASAIADGTIIYRQWVKGYGGVLIERCTIDGQPVTVLYGHIRIASVTKRVGDSLKSGERFAVLGSAYSQETDGERRHLHLGIHRGSGIALKGYVQNKTDLAGWIDPLMILR